MEFHCGGDLLSLLDRNNNRFNPFLLTAQIVQSVSSRSRYSQFPFPRQLGRGQRPLLHSRSVFGDPRSSQDGICSQGHQTGEYFDRYYFELLLQNKCIPQNLISDRTGHLKLADFGNAARLSTAGTVSKVYKLDQSMGKEC